MTNRDIFYLEPYEKCRGKCHSGFVKINDRSFTINIRKTNYEAIEIIEATMQTINGKEKSITLKKEGSRTQLVYIGYTDTPREEINRIIISLSNSEKLIANMQDEEKKVLSKIEASNYDTCVTMIPTIEEDKWNEIYKNHQKLHIYPEADTIMIKPNEIVLLTSQYHNLANNSFVLHSYYNYRQLLLFRYKQEGKMVYYLGVPGIYHDRDKRVAMMFGFEAFENGESRLEEESQREAYNGCFGYYMKEVDI